MAKITEKYESIVVFSLKLDEEAIQGLVQKFTDIITDNGGTFEGLDEWGKRKLAYPINYETEGHYILFKYTSQPSLPAEFDRVCKITDGIIRYLSVKQEVA